MIISRQALAGLLKVAVRRSRIVALLGPRQDDETFILFIQEINRLRLIKKLI